MRLKILFLILIISGINIFALNVSEVVEFAVKNSKEYKKIELDFKKRINTFKDQLNNFRPNFSYSIDDDKDKSYSVSQKISEGGSLSYSENDYANNTQSKSLSIRQNIFSWKDYNGIINKINYRIAVLNYDESKQNFILSVVDDYFDIIKKQESLKIEQQSLDSWKTSYDYAVARFNSGSANKFSVLNANLNLLNSKKSILAQKDSLEYSKDKFKIKIGMSLEKDIKFDEKIEFVKVEKKEAKSRNDLKVYILNHEISRINREQDKLKVFPDISVSTTHSENTSGVRSWSGSLTYSFSLCESGDKLSYKSSIIDNEKSKINLDLKEKNVKIEIENYERNLRTYELTLKIMQEKLNIAEESYKFSQISFQKGLISYIDLQDSQSKFSEARRNYISSLIDNRMLILNYIKAIGGDIHEYIK